jgi:hypothetical protein
VQAGPVQPARAEDLGNLWRQGGRHQRDQADAGACGVGCKRRDEGRTSGRLVSSPLDHQGVEGGSADKDQLRRTQWSRHLSTMAIWKRPV